MVAIYSEQLRTVGRYEYVCAAVILRSSIDVPHYRLIAFDNLIWPTCDHFIWPTPAAVS